MYKSCLAFILVLVLYAFSTLEKAYSQDQHSSGWYDSITYQSYLKGEWPSVIRFGKDAIMNGNDYYFLRMRLGAAYYEQGNYRMAIRNYSKALKFNTDDDFAKNGIYHSYLNLGNRDGALMASNKISIEKKDSLNINSNNFLDFVYLEMGYSPSSGNRNSPGLGGDSKSIYSEFDLQKDLFYTMLGARIRLMPSLAVFAGFTKMNINKENRYSYTSVSAHLDVIRDTSYGKDYIYSFPKKNTDSSFSYKIIQNESYINVTYMASGGLKITPALHFIQVQFSKISPVLKFPLTDTAFYLSKDSSWHTFDYQSGAYSFTQLDTSISNFVFSLNASKDFGNFTLELYGSISDFNRMKLAQLGTSVTWYPMGNTNLCATTTAVSVFSNKRPRMVYEQSLGFRLFRNTWLTGFVTLGNLDLYNEKNAYIVYNQPDPVIFRTGIDMTILVGKHMEVGLMYRFYRKEYQVLKYASGASSGMDPLLISVFSKQNYTNQSFTGGLKWKF
jgi:tetratricopeptide (TPR) repeat protein